MKKKYFYLFITLLIFILASCFICEIFREYKCSDYEEYEKATLIINKIENYRQRCGKLPDSLEDIGEKETMEGPIFYKKIDSEKYEVWFSYYFGEGCIYNSETKKWIP